MAYRFNAPPNWPVNEPGWTPPPGWQPDPSWGPAPEGWTFWVEEDAEQGHAGEQSTGGLPDEGAADATDAADDATRVVGGGEVPAEPVGGTAHEDGSAFASSAGSARTSETAEYAGPDLDGDLRSDAPYESAAPGSSAAGSTGHDPQPDDARPDGSRTHDPQPHDSHTHDHHADLGGAAAAGSAHESVGGTSPGTYGQGDAYGTYPGYGQSDATGYGQYAGGDDAQGAHAGYGAAPAYDQASSNGYGQGSAPEAYGSPSPAPGPWQGAGAPAKPAKSALARFWWIGCVILLVLALLIGLIGWALLKGLGGGSEDPGTGSTTTATAQASQTPSPSAESSQASPEVVTPSVLPTVNAAAKQQAITTTDGKGQMKVSTEWVTADKLPSSYGDGGVTAPENGQYLAVTAWVKVDQGTLDMNNFRFAVVTPYGGEVTSALATYELKDSGIGSSAPTEIKAGEQYTIKILYDIKKNPGLKVRYDTYDNNKYEWDVPA